METSGAPQKRQPAFRHRRGNPAPPPALDDPVRRLHPRILGLPHVRHHHPDLPALHRPCRPDRPDGRSRTAIPHPATTTNPPGKDRHVTDQTPTGPAQQDAADPRGLLRATVESLLAGSGLKSASYPTIFFLMTRRPPR